MIHITASACKKCKSYFKFYDGKINLIQDVLKIFMSSILCPPPPHAACAWLEKKKLINSNLHMESAPQPIKLAAHFRQNKFSLSIYLASINSEGNEINDQYKTK